MAKREEIIRDLSKTLQNPNLDASIKNALEKKLRKLESGRTINKHPYV